MANDREQNKIVERTLTALKNNKFNPIFVSNRQEALQSVLSNIPIGSVVGVGYSLTLKEIHIIEELKKETLLSIGLLMK